MTGFIQKCTQHTFTALFPDDVKNRGWVILINILHIIGVLAIQFGILLPPQFMKYYIVYLVFLLSTYIILNNRCFMTEISNYLGGKNYNTLCIKMKEAKKLLLVYLVIGIFFELYPDYSIYSILTNMYKKKY